MENVNKQRRNWNSTSGGFAYIWQSKWVEIIEIKTERTQIHCLSDVLVAVASLDLKVTFICSSWTYRINTSRNRAILFRRIEFKASYSIKFDDYATYKMNQLNSSEKMDSAKKFYRSFWNFELKCTYSLKNCFHFHFLWKKNVYFLGENSTKILECMHLHTFT